MKVKPAQLVNKHVVEPRFRFRTKIPVEMHQVQIVKQISLLPLGDRVQAIDRAYFNTFLLKREDVFLDMLNDSGTNAMSDRAQSSMLQADGAYAGARTFYRLQQKLEDIYGMSFFLPTHQGRAAEHMLARAFVKPGDQIPMNYHFTTIQALIKHFGGEVVELVHPGGLQVVSDVPFKGDFDVSALEKFLSSTDLSKVPFVRVEAGTNLIGGQPVSMSNLRAVSECCRRHGIRLIMDATLLQDNLYFIKQRENGYKDTPIPDLIKEITSLIDILYFSARKLGFGVGGGILFREEADYSSLRDFIPLFEGFLTYGGMSSREMEAIATGMDEVLEESVINQGPEFIQYAVNRLQDRDIPVVLPAGGLGVHIDVRSFLPHLDSSDYPAAALAAAVYVASGIRTMDRGSLAAGRDSTGTDIRPDMELLRLAVPRRVYTISQLEYMIDRITWLFECRDLIGGLSWVEEPEVLRFFSGRLQADGNWHLQLAAAFTRDYGSDQ